MWLRIFFLISICSFAFFSLCPPALAEHVSYEYDDFGRLKNTTYDDGYSLTDIGYLYDNVGNFTSETITKTDNPSPQIATSPLSVGFGAVYTGSIINQAVTISNTGGVALSISDMSISGTDEAMFQITSNGCADVTLPVGGICSVILTAAPTSTTSTGAKSASLNITSDDIYNPVRSVALYGLVYWPALTVYKQGGGAGTVTSVPDAISCGNVCATTFTNPTSVTLTATADAGNSFIGWGGDCSGSSPSCSVLVGQSSNVIAIFNKP